MEHHIIAKRTPYDPLRWATDPRMRCLTTWVPEPVERNTVVKIELRPDRVLYATIRFLWNHKDMAYARECSFYYRERSRETGVTSFYGDGDAVLPTPEGTGSCCIMDSTLVLRNMPNLTQFRVVYLVDSWEAHIMAREQHV